MRLVILDRDGVINEDSDDYIKTPEEWRPIPGSLEAIARLTHAGIQVVVATNQSGIARGLFNVDMLGRIHNRMLGEISACITKGRSREALAEECADLLILLMGTAISADFALDRAFWNKMEALMKRSSRMVAGRIRVSEFRDS